MNAIDVYIVAVEMERYGSSEEHIARVAWDVTPDGAKAQWQWATTDDMIVWIRAGKFRAWVKDSAGPGYAVVTVVWHHVPRPFLRTEKDNKVTDNLLYLPGGPKGPKI